jgi:hypothetical protein
MGERKNAYKNFVRKREMKRKFGISRHRYEDNIRMDLKESVLECVNWMHVVEETDQWRAVVKTVMNLRFP